MGTLAAFELNLGDCLILLACLLYAGYTLALRNRPNIPSLVFFAAMAIIAFVTSLPLLAYEVVTGTVQLTIAVGMLLQPGTDLGQGGWQLPVLEGGAIAQGAPTSCSVLTVAVDRGRSCTSWSTR